MSWRPLTAELGDKESPVRRFFDSRFTTGLREVQRRYRSAAPALAVPSAPDRREANPGTVGTASDWLLRFLLYPQPSLALAARGAALCGRRSGMAEALIEIVGVLGYDESAFETGHGAGTDFAGPARGSGASSEFLARACWAMALLTEMFRNPMAAVNGPLGRFRHQSGSADELLAMASPAALGQLAGFRQVFETTLLPELARRPGRWSIGPEFTGSALIKADADLITRGLLIDLKTDSKFSLGVTVLFQIIGYALLDFDDDYVITELGTFSARYAHLATWDMGALLEELAGGPVDVPAVRDEFRQLLRRGQGRP